MQFWKMNGAGNDFIIINNTEEQLPADVFPTLARTLCHRHLSIGADGLMVIEKASGSADFKMLFFNFKFGTKDLVYIHSSVFPFRRYNLALKSNTNVCRTVRSQHYYYTIIRKKFQEA